MNIAYLITRSDSIGGAQVHVRDLAAALQERGHQVTVLVGGEGPFTIDLAEHGLTCRSLHYLGRPIRPFRDWRALAEIKAALREIKPDLVAAHSSKAGWLGRIAARSLGIPVTFTVHGWSFTEGVKASSAAIYRRAERLAAPLASRIITVCEYDRELGVSARVSSREQLIAVHNGMPDLAPELLADPQAEPPRLVMVARFEAQKDHATLLRALAEIEASNWSLELIGDGPLRAEMEALSARLGLAGRVQFPGVCRDVAERLKRAQLFVLATNWEGFPLTILEAMRAGLPVVASDVGGVKEAVADGETGYVIPRGDVIALREKIGVLITDPQARVRLGAAGRKRFAERFTLEQMVEKTLAAYRELLEGQESGVGSQEPE